MSEEAVLARPLISQTMQHHKQSLSFVYLAFSFPALAGLLFGFDIGATSGAVHSIGQVFTLSTSQRALLTSASLIGATIGSVSPSRRQPIGRAL